MEESMNVWEISISPSQFLLKPKTASKEKKRYKNKERELKEQYTKK